MDYLQRYCVHTIMQNITTLTVHISSMFLCGGEIGSTDAGGFEK